MRRDRFLGHILPIDVLNYAGVPLLAIYGFSIFVYPWFASGSDWRHVQEVWDRWQTLNAGALAFLASLVAFNISRYSESQQREREFLAAKAFLPSTLSGLMGYCSESARILESLWEAGGERRQPIPPPSPPEDYREVFSSCIRHSTPAVGAYLVRILVLLQVHESRLQVAIAPALGRTERVVDRHSLLAYVMRLGELYALLGGLFGFARGEEPFRSQVLTWSELHSAYRILDLEIEDLYIDESMNLEVFTKRWLERVKINVSKAT